MSEYGYIPEAPEQSFGNNKGIFTPKDIYDLTRADKYTNYGQLELIETQTVTTSTAYVDFTNLGNYNVHFITANNVHNSVDGVYIKSQVSNNGGTSFHTSGYQYARQRNYIVGGTGFSQEGKSTNINLINILGNSGNSSSEAGNSYAYFYNLLDSSKYSFSTFQQISVPGIDLDSYFGSGVYPTAEIHNAIRIIPDSGTILECSLSLYGIKEYS